MDRSREGTDCFLLADHPQRPARLRDYVRVGDLSSKSTLLAVGFSFAKIGRGMVGAVKFLRDYDVVGFSKTCTKIPPVLAMGGSGRFHTGSCSLCPAIKNSRQKFGF